MASAASPFYCNHGGPPVGSDAYKQRLPLALKLVERMDVSAGGSTLGNLQDPPTDLLSNQAQIADTLLLKLIYAKTVDAVLHDNDDDGMVKWFLSALFVEAYLTKDPTLTARVSGDILSEGQAVKWVYKQVPCKCLRILLKTKYKQNIKSGFCIKCKKEEQDHTKLMQCSKCKVSTYCSKKCQIADWPDHKPVCKLTQAYYAKSGNNNVKKVDKQKKAGDTALDARLADSMAKLKLEEERRRDELRRELYWCCGVDLDEYDDPNCNIIKHLFYQESLRANLPAVKELTPEERQYRAKCQRDMARVRKQYEELPEDSVALMEEAFALLDINDDVDEAAYHDTEYNSATKATARVKEILSSGAEGISVNLLSTKDGESLLYRVCSNYRLKEESTGQALDLVKFLLENGADPNLENILAGGSAFDCLDYDHDLQEMTAEWLEIYDVLKAAGAKLQPLNDAGEKIGKRGDPDYVGFLEGARKKQSEDTASS